MKRNRHVSPLAAEDAGRMWQDLLYAAQSQPWLLRLLGERGPWTGSRRFAALWAGIAALLAGIGPGIRRRRRGVPLRSPRTEVASSIQAQPSSVPDPSVSAYQPPAVVHSGALKQVVGSAPAPNVPLDILDLGD